MDGHQESATQVKPVAAGTPALCECGERVYAKGKCTRCYQREYRRQQRGSQPRPVKQPGYCVQGHALENNVYAKGQCKTCVKITQAAIAARRAEERKAAGLPPLRVADRPTCRHGHPRTEENTIIVHLPQGDVRRCRLCFNAAMRPVTARQRQKKRDEQNKTQ